MQATSSLEAFAIYSQKFNPDQPRIPAGSVGGGQWTSGDDGTLTDGITQVYPLETAIMLFLDGASLLGDAISGGVGGAVDAGVSDTAGAAAEDAGSVTQNLVDTLAPNGTPIGNPGTSPWIRELPGGSDAAEQMFQDLTKGGTLYMPESYTGIDGYKLPDNSWFGYRPDSSSGLPTMDVNVAPLRGIVQKLKFLD